LPTLNTYLTDCGRLNMPEVEMFLEYLGGIEDQVFKNRLERDSKRRSEVSEVRAPEGPGGEGPLEKPSANPTGQAGGDLAGGGGKKKKAAPKAEASDTNAWHAQLLAQSFSMDLENLEGGGDGEEPDAKKAKEDEPEKPKSGKIVDREFHQALKDRLKEREDLGEAMADTVRLGEGPHWKQRYYFEKFKVKQDDLIDFLQRIRKAYCEGLCWVLIYYYQGCASWTWFYPYHYAPFASDLIGCSTLKCGDLTYFSKGKPFMPFQQLMSVLPPVSAEAAGIPASMRELMNQPFSPLVDFYPQDFGLDLNGKRFTWQAVILLPFIDEPRLVRILAPLLKRITPNEKVRNRHGTELIMGHNDDAVLKHTIQLAQAAFEAGHAGLKQVITDRVGGLFGHLEGYQGGGIGQTVVSPIEGLPDVEESHLMSAQYYLPEFFGHSSKLLQGIHEQRMVVNASDMDEQARLKGFGGEPARRMILQALGKNPDVKPVYKTADCVPCPTPAAAKTKTKTKTTTAAATAEPAHWGEEGAVEPEEEVEQETGAAPAPPTGTKVIKVHRKRADDGLPEAPKGFKAVRKAGAAGRSAPY